MSDEKSDKETYNAAARGCVCLIGIICLALGIGTLFGSAWGWFTVAGVLLADWLITMVAGSFKKETD